MAFEEKKRERLMLVIIAIIIILFFASAFLLPVPWNLVGNFLYPIEEEAPEPIGPSYSRASLITPLTGAVLSGSSEIVFNFSTNSPGLSEMQLFLTYDSINVPLKTIQINSSGRHSFFLDTANFLDRKCGYKLTMRVYQVSSSNYSQSSTGFFTVLNSPLPVVMGIFQNGISTDLTKVKWPTQSEIRLYQSGIGSVIFPPGEVMSGVTIAKVLLLSKNNFEVLETGFPCSINRAKKFTLEFEGVTFLRPKLLLNGADCDTKCVIKKYSDGKLVVDVYKFGKILVQEGLKASLTISNPTLGLKPYIIGETVTFTANYINLNTGKPLTGKTISCKMKRSEEQEQNMVYNSITKLYTLRRSFDRAGRFFYSVLCSDTSNSDRKISAQDMFDIW